MDGAMVRNSRILGVFAEIVHGPQGTLRAVEIAGRGIVAEVQCTFAVLADKRTATGTSDAALQLQDAVAYADRLMTLGAVEDDLAELWRRRRMDEIEDADFEETLQDIVQRLEMWPQ